MANDTKTIGVLKDKAEKLFSKGRFEKALKTYEGIRQYGKDDPRIFMRIGDIARKLDKKEAAIASYKDAIEIFAKQGFIVKAIAVCKIITHLDPNETDVQKRLAELCGDSSSSGHDTMTSQDIPTLIPAPSAAPPMPEPIASPKITPPVEAPTPTPIKAPPVKAPKVEATTTPTPKPAPKPAPTPEPKAKPAPTPEPKAKPAAKAEPAPAPKPAKPKAPVKPIEDTPLFEPEETPDVESVIEPIIEDVIEVAEEIHIDEPIEEPPLAEIPVETPEAPVEAAEAVETAEAPGSPLLEVGGLLGEEELMPAKAPMPTEEAPAIEAAQKKGFPKTPLFSDFNKEELFDIVNKVQFHTFASGHTVFDEKDKGTSIYIVVSGSLNITGKAKDGANVSISTLKEGDFFGEFAFFSGAKRKTSVKTLEATELLELKKSDMDNIIKTHPRVTEILFDFYKERVVDRLMALSEVFRPLTPNDRKAILKNVEQKNYKKNESIMVEGEKGDKMYLIKSGQVVVWIDDKMGGETVITELEEGEYFGEIALATNKPRLATVTALTDVETVIFSRHLVKDILAKYPEIKNILLGVIKERQTDSSRFKPKDPNDQH